MQTKHAKYIMKNSLSLVQVLSVSPQQETHAGMEGLTFRGLEINTGGLTTE